MGSIGGGSEPFCVRSWWAGRLGCERNVVDNLDGDISSIIFIQIMYK